MATYNQPFVRLTWGGTFDGEEEIWTNNLSIVGVNGTLPAVWTAETIPTAITTAIGAFHSAAASQISSRAKLAWVKVATIGIDGKYQTEAVTYDYPTPVAGGSAGSVETTRSLAVSLKTQFPRGLAANGRFYIPGFNATVGTNGRVTTANATGLLGTATTLINALNVAFDAAITESVKVGVTAFAEVNPRQAVATSIRIGDVVDSQRRRKNKMLETYVSGPVAP